MSVFDELFRKVLSNFSEWIEVYDFKSQWTIDDFPYQTGVDEKQTYPHCWRCVTVNHCWFKNEEDKKPKEMIYIGNLLKVLQKNRGLYHPNCHCEKLSIANPTQKEIELIIPDGKIGWMIKDKGHLIKIMGYSEEEFSEFAEIFLELCKQSYESGNYKMREHTKHGFKITLYVNCPGKNLKNGHKYKLESAWTIFPKGKLKCNTIIGGMIK